VQQGGVEIGAYTGLLGIFGYPVRHTLSPRMHNAALAAQGLDLVYLAFEVAPKALAPAVDSIRALGMRGVNLTMPHKEAVIPLLDTVSPLAARVGAVNTVVNDGGALAGHNTDISGFTAALHTLLPSGAKGEECVVIGAGGAARGVLAALVDGGAARVSVHNRHHERAVDLCALASTWGATECVPIKEQALADTVASAQLLVNATSLGLEGSVKELPLPVDRVHSGHVIVDLVYGVEPTALVQVARRRGAVAIDGKEMLLMQAALAYELWIGAEAPLSVMRDSIERLER
jgi:shikimate dehydrogenase